jgi:hypothetical protein
MIGVVAVKGIPVIVAPIQTWRAFVLGSGKLQRDEAHMGALANCGLVSQRIHFNFRVWIDHGCCTPKGRCKMRKLEAVRDTPDGDYTLTMVSPAEVIERAEAGETLTRAQQGL